MIKFITVAIWRNLRVLDDCKNAECTYFIPLLWIFDSYELLFFTCIMYENAIVVNFPQSYYPNDYFSARTSALMTLNINFKLSPRQIGPFLANQTWAALKIRHTKGLSGMNYAIKCIVSYGTTILVLVPIEIKKIQIVTSVKFQPVLPFIFFWASYNIFCWSFTKALIKFCWQEWCLLHHHIRYS